MAQPKFISFSRNGRPGYGLLTERGVIDLSARDTARWRTLRDVIEDGALVSLADKCAALSPDFSVGKCVTRSQFPHRRS
jgi:hypothetical protein